jgi:hypothetical protein
MKLFDREQESFFVIYLTSTDKYTGYYQNISDNYPLNRKVTMGDSVCDISLH